ncbi:hypothetical protein A176_006794 [Myxococcus hansupus]|uniref:Uncharacterized protein n=1 Tax=Pseudomyxococcus hansupus TaxID=1297742 RepID=A0A0H4XNB8_9BACT|nr:hypothetical protein A176_006794 [Myxococcus hansupus]
MHGLAHHASSPHRTVEGRSMVKFVNGGLNTSAAHVLLTHPPSAPRRAPRT